MKNNLLMRWRCYQISKGKKKINRLVNQGVPLSSPKLVKLGNRVTDHCFKAGLFTMSQ